MNFLKSIGGTLLPSQVVVLYHAVTPPGVYPVLDNNADVIHPDVFQRHLKWLGRFYDFAPLSDVVDAIKSGSRERVAAVTFDDGYKCVHEYAAPILHERKIPFTIFLVPELLSGNIFWRDGIRVIISSGEELNFLEYLGTTGYDAPSNEGSLYRWSKSPKAGNSRIFATAVQSYITKIGRSDASDNLYLKISDIQALARHGVSFGNHTNGHVVLATLDKDEQRSEIANGASSLSNTVKIDEDVLSLPFGGKSDWNADTVNVAAELGYSTILSTVTDRPRSRYHMTRQGQLLEIKRAIGASNLKGLFRSVRGR